MKTGAALPGQAPRFQFGMSQFNGPTDSSICRDTFYGVSLINPYAFALERNASLYNAPSRQTDV